MNLESEVPRCTASVPGPSTGIGTLTPVDHRTQVLRRLLARGLSPLVLARMLPEWRGLIEDLASCGRD